MGTIGWRREKVSAGEKAASDAAARVAGTRWRWGEDERGLAFGSDGTLVTPWGKGTWGVLGGRQAAGAGGGGGGGDEDGIKKCTGCLFADFANANHNLRFDFGPEPPVFTALRVGDMARVDGKLVGKL